MLRKIKRDWLRPEFKEKKKELKKKNSKEVCSFSDLFHEKYGFTPNISKLELKLKDRKQKKKRKLRRKNKQRKEVI